MNLFGPPKDERRIGATLVTFVYKTRDLRREAKLVAARLLSILPHCSELRYFPTIEFRFEGRKGRNSTRLAHVDAGEAEHGDSIIHLETGPLLLLSETSPKETALTIDHELLHLRTQLVNPEIERALLRRARLERAIAKRVGRDWLDRLGANLGGRGRPQREHPLSELKDAFDDIWHQLLCEGVAELYPSLHHGKLDLTFESVKRTYHPAFSLVQASARLQKDSLAPFVRAFERAARSLGLHMVHVIAFQGGLTSEQMMRLSKKSFVKHYEHAATHIREPLLVSWSDGRGLVDHDSIVQLFRHQAALALQHA